MNKRFFCMLALLMITSLLPLCVASAADVCIPDFAVYAGKELVKTETHNGLTIYFLSEDTASSVLGAYAKLLETDYGFKNANAKKKDSIGYVWFADHDTVEPEVFDGELFEGTCSFMFAMVGAGEGLEQVILQPGNGFVMMDTGERYGVKPSNPCEKCDGTGKCQNCGGDMWFEGYKQVWHGIGRSALDGDWSYEYVRELCHDDNCYGGSCKACGGDGEI